MSMSFCFSEFSLPSSSKMLPAKGFGWHDLYSGHVPSPKTQVLQELGQEWFWSAQGILHMRLPCPHPASSDLSSNHQLISKRYSGSNWHLIDDKSSPGDVLKIKNNLKSLERAQGWASASCPGRVRVRTARKARCHGSVGEGSPPDGASEETVSVWNDVEWSLVTVSSTWHCNFLKKL